jgi:anti-anti-sigma factor
VPNQDDVVWYLRVEDERTDTVIVLTATGRVSHLTSPALNTALASAIDSPVAGVVLDLSGVDYISSTGLHAVESASNRMTGEGRTFVICGLKDAVRVAFSLAGLAAALTIEPSREAALARARA